MDNTKLKKIIISIVAVSVILALLIISIVLVLVNREGSDTIISEPSENNNTIDTSKDDDEDQEYLEVENSEYTGIRNCLLQYINMINFESSIYYSINDNNEYVFSADEKEISKSVYDMLSTEYIEKNNIDSEEVFKYIEKINQVNLPTVLEVKKIKEEDNMKSIVGHVLVQDIENYSIIQELFIVVNIDDNNSTFSLEPLSNINDMSEVKFETNLKEIQANDNNTFEYRFMSDQDIIMEYLNIFKRVSLVAPGYVYNNILDKDYRESRFGSAQEFAKYVSENKESIESINLQKYQTDTSNYDYTQYVCIDQNGKYYIFRGESMIKYALLLDTYSIDIPEFIEKYDSASDTNKVSLNVNKIVEAVNNKDYNYIYNKLNETFRTNNFGSVDDLEKYIKNTFYDNNVMKQSTCKQEGNVYECTIQISNEDDTEKLKNITIIMQLLDNRDFVMSLST